MAQEPKKREQWWLNLKLGMAGDTRFILAPKGQLAQTFEDEQFEYFVEVITESGRKIRSESGGYRTRRKELEEGKGGG